MHDPITRTARRQRHGQSNPQGYPRVTPYLIVDDGAAAIDFYVAPRRDRADADGGTRGCRVGHAELNVGDSVIMLADEHPEMNAPSDRRPLGGTPVSIHVYVEDSDGAFERAIEAGAKSLAPV